MDSTFIRWQRSSGTVEDYADLVRRLALRHVPEAGGINGMELWIMWLERLREKPWVEVTARRYKAALLWFLESLDTFEGSPFWIEAGDREKIEAAIRLPWAGQSLVMPIRKKAPGKRMRSFGQKWERLKARLLAENRVEAVLWMESGMRTGARPIEWVRGLILVESRSSVLLRIPCAKGAFTEQGDRVRGLEEWRTLDLSHWKAEDRRIVREWLRLSDDTEGRAKLLKKIARDLRVAWDAEFRTLRPRITLYTARHQFAANLRAARINKAAIAAMMGHSSDRTHGTHYGRGGQGRGGAPLPEVNASLIAKVRQHQSTVPLPFRVSL